MKKDLLRQFNGLAKFQNDECDYFVNSKDMNVESAKFCAAMDLSVKIIKAVFLGIANEPYTVHLDQ